VQNKGREEVVNGKVPRKKRILAVAEKIEARGCDPIEGMARIAMDENTELSLRAQMYKELAQYVAPKRKAIEVRDEAGQSFIDALREATSLRKILSHNA
jgi:hypothetical protein